MKRLGKYLFAAILVLGIVALAFSRASRIVSAEHDRFDNNIDAFIKRDARLNEDVLKIRFHLLSDYDGLHEQISGLKDAVASLTPIPAFVSPASRQLMEQQVREMSELLVQKEQLLEDFKSQNAVLDNSVRYLPVAGIRLLRRVATNDATRPLEVPLNELMQQMLTYSLAPNEDLEPSIRQALEQMAGWQSQHPENLEARTLASLIAHANSILRRKPLVETVTRNIVSLPTGTRAEALLTLYENEFNQALQAADSHRLVLQILCGVLVLGIGYALFALAKANRHLEQRVAERTCDLQAEIAERTRAEETLRMQARVIENMKEGVAVADEQGRIVTVNPACERMFGYEPGELVGQPVTVLHVLDEAESKRFLAETTALIQGGSSWHGEIKRRRKDGSTFITDTQASSFKVGGKQHYFSIQEDITERKRATAELEATHKQLLAASHQAGMAEVATSVLHNVGNVLNSVNVSANLISGLVKKSKNENLVKIAQMLKENASDLGTYLTHDPRGQKLPAFLEQMADYNAKNQQEILSEVGSLGKNIEHIKDIVAMQQSYAKVSGATETVAVADLVEDSLRMNAGGLVRHDVQVIREFKEVPPVTVEKHKVLQILVNLIRNAKMACDESGRAEKILTVRIANGDGRIKISVADNGIGIPPENLTLIFNHGFTTRKDGHGFGLHSAANAAQEMGGSLLAYSEGRGHGARFTLELPVTDTHS